MLPLHIEPHGSQEIILNNIFLKSIIIFAGASVPFFYEKKTGECDILIKKSVIFATPIWLYLFCFIGELRLPFFIKK